MSALVSLVRKYRVAAAQLRQCVCFRVLDIKLAFFFYPSTTSTSSVRADSSFRERYNVDKKLGDGDRVLNRKHGSKEILQYSMQCNAKRTGYEKQSA